MTCTIDRIRETQVSSRHGLPANLTEILTNFYKDDVLQPKPSPKLRLQEYYIKTLLQQLSIDKNSSAQMVMLDIMIDCNRLHLLRWSEKLEILTYQRGIVQGDLKAKKTKTAVRIKIILVIRLLIAFLYNTMVALTINPIAMGCIKIKFWSPSLISK